MKNSKYAELLTKYKNREMTRETILMTYEISKESLRKLIDYYNIPFWDLQKNYNDLDVNEIKNLLAKGYSKYKIAAILKCSYDKIKNFCRHNGIKTIDGRLKRKNPERDKEILNLYKQGISIREIANKLRITYQSVYEVLRKLGAFQKIRKVKVVRESGKYYHPKRDKSPYAQMFYTYNN